MTVTNPQTLRALRDIGCLVNDKVNTTALAGVIARRLEDAHIAHSKDDVVAVQVTAGELASALVGQVDPEFVETLKPLLATGAKGAVQLALTNGYMLCSGRMSVEGMVEGEVRNTSVGTRFLSGDPDVLESFLFGPRVRRAQAAAHGYVALGELAEQRQPNLAPQVAGFRERLTITWQKAIGQ